MKSSNAIAALKALAHARRLEIYRVLVQAGPGGMTVGALQTQTRHAAATLSNHLNALRHAGLVSDRRDGRNIWCGADYARMNAVYAGYFPVDRRPARTCIGVTALARGARVEIDLLARRPGAP